MNTTTQTIDKFDRTFGALQDVALCSKPTTIEYVEPVTGRVQTFVVQTFRTENGDYIFIKTMDDGGLIRIALPPKVTATMSRQKVALSKRSRSLRGKRVMQERMASPDWKPPVPPQRRKKKA